MLEPCYVETFCVMIAVVGIRMVKGEDSIIKGRVRASRCNFEKWPHVQNTV